MPYRLYVPAGYDAKAKYPLVLWLHGAAGRGNDDVLQISAGNTLGSHIWTRPENQAKFPAFVLAPQCPADEYWPRPRRRGARAAALGARDSRCRAKGIQHRSGSCLRCGAIDGRRRNLGGSSVCARTICGWHTALRLSQPGRSVERRACAGLDISGRSRSNSSGDGGQRVCRGPQESGRHTAIQRVSGNRPPSLGKSVRRAGAGRVARRAETPEVDDPSRLALAPRLRAG
jgi:hypothetical protein